MNFSDLSFDLIKMAGLVEESLQNVQLKQATGMSQTVGKLLVSSHPSQDWRFAMLANLVLKQ